MVWFGAIMVAVLFLVFVVVAGKRQSVKTPDASREILTGMKFPADPRLVDYLRLGIESGRPIAPMLRELYKLGWSEIELNEAMGRAMASAKPHTSQKPKAMKEPQSEKPAAK